jgi:hypothetical protein
VQRSVTHGKGLVAARDFAEGERVLVEAPLIGMQQEGNRADALAGLVALCWHFAVKTPADDLMTPSVVHVTSLAPPGSDNPSRAYGQKHQLMTAGMAHVTNLTPGSECNPVCVHVTNLTPGSECNRTRRCAASASATSAAWSTRSRGGF